MLAAEEATSGLRATLTTAPVTTRLESGVYSPCFASEESNVEARMALRRARLAVARRYNKKITKNRRYTQQLDIPNVEKRHEGRRER